MKVGVFNDWGQSFDQIMWIFNRVHSPLFCNNKYKNIEFVENGYDYAVVFNFPVEEILCPQENVIGLVLEPPEILDLLYKNRPRVTVPGVGRMYAFCSGTEFPEALGIGLPTAAPISSPVKGEHSACMFVSNKMFTPYHSIRHTVANALRDSDLNIVFYGWGSENQIPVYTKDAIIKDYTFCIDFENSPHNAITDKFFDPILVETFPITNAKVLFEIAHQDSFFYIDFSLPVEKIVSSISDIINLSDEELERRKHGLLQTKNFIRYGHMSILEWIWKTLNG